MRRKTSDEDEGGLDSLLDTMTNVVGILVIVLVVTQLGVGDAVKRITDAIQIEPEQLAEAEKELADRQAEYESMLAAMSKDNPPDDSNYDEDMRKLQQQIENQQRVLEQLKVDKEARENALKETKQAVTDSEKRKKEIEEAREKAEALSEQWTSTDEEVDRLRALLAETPDRVTPPAREVVLPDPRPAPEGAKQLTIVCSQNKVYLVPASPVLEVIRKQAQAWAVVIYTKVKRNFNPVTGEGTELFLNEFNERPLHDPNDYFDIKLYNSNSYPRLMFYPRENAGEDERAVTGTRSRFQKALQGVDPNMFFIRFYVCSDSFDIYVTTRRIVSDIGLLAGWDPQSTNWKYTTHLGGELRFGPPPPPPKKPPTAKPQPTKPADVID